MQNNESPTGDYTASSCRNGNHPRLHLVKSRIGAPADQKRTLDALGLRKLNRVVEHESTPSILGMVDKVKHLVTIVK